MVTLKEEHELVERGPNRFVRHPIYTGILTCSLRPRSRKDTCPGLWAHSYCLRVFGSNFATKKN